MDPKQQAILQEQMAKIIPNPENGTSFYKFLFGEAPQLRAFFKGAENIEPAAVPASERFHKQGTRLLTSIHVIVDLAARPVAFDAYVRELINKHRMFKMQFAHYEAFFPLYIQFVEKTTGSMDQEAKDAWTALAKQFLDVTKAHLGL